MPFEIILQRSMKHAIEKKRTTLKTTGREQRLQRRLNELSALYEISKLLTSALDLDEVLNLIVKTTANIVGVKACGLRLLNKDTGEMVLRAAHGLSQEYIHKGRVFAWKGVYKDVISKGQVAIVYDVATDPRFEYTEEAMEEGIKSMLSVGLLIQGEPIYRPTSPLYQKSGADLQEHSKRSGCGHRKGNLV